MGTETTVQLKVSAPYLDNVGDNLLWFKWSFYNDDLACDTTRFENYCFSTAPIDGQKSGYFYSTYINWADYYDKSEMMTFYWVNFGLSLFWIAGQPAQILVGIALQIYLLIKSIIGYSNAAQHGNVETY